MGKPPFEKLIRKVNLYPPYLGMGIRVKSVSPDYRRFQVVLRQRWYNRNLFGTHFGGCLYSMADPFFVFIVTMNLGRDYIVWDQSAGIDFLKPARGTITGVFEVDAETLNRIRNEVDRSGRETYRFEAPLRDETGTTVAVVRKEVYVRAKAPRA
jgi:acyl-coenzyme A thioesterase PaaI-like protein